MSSNDQVVDHFIELASRHGESVDLLVVYGSWLHGDQGPRSDVDVYFVPSNDRAWSLSHTFILGEVGYDLFGMTWPRLQAIADLADPLTPLVGQAKVLLGTDAGRARFAQLQADLGRRLQQPEVRRDRAREALGWATDQLAAARAADHWSGIREASGLAVIHLAQALLWGQGRYLDRGVKGLFDSLAALPELPPGWFEHSDRLLVATSPATAVQGLAELIELTAISLGQPVPPGTLPEPPQGPWADPRGWLEELWSSFAKLDSCAQTGNWRLALLTAANLNSSLRHDLGPQWQTPLLEQFDPADLTGLADRCWQVAQALADQLSGQGHPLHRFDSLDQVRAAGLGMPR